MSRDLSPVGEQWASQFQPLSPENGDGGSKAFGPGGLSNRLAASAQSDSVSGINSMQKQNKHDALLQLLRQPNAKASVNAPDAVPNEANTAKDSSLGSKLSSKSEHEEHGTDYLCPPHRHSQKRRKIDSKSTGTGHPSWDPKTPLTRKIVQIPKDQRAIIDANNSWYHLVSTIEENSHPLTIIPEHAVAHDQDDEQSSQVSWERTPPRNPQTGQVPNHDDTAPASGVPRQPEEVEDRLLETVTSFVERQDGSRASSILERIDSDPVESPVRRDFHDLLPSSPPDGDKEARVSIPLIPSSSAPEDELEVEIPAALKDSSSTVPVNVRILQSVASQDSQTQPSPLVERTPYPNQGQKWKVPGPSRSPETFRGCEGPMHISSSISSDHIIPGTFNAETVLRLDMDVCADASAPMKGGNDSFGDGVGATLLQSPLKSEIASPNSPSIRSQSGWMDHTFEENREQADIDSQLGVINSSRSQSPCHLKTQDSVQQHHASDQTDEEGAVRRSTADVSSKRIISCSQPSSPTVPSPQRPTITGPKFGFSQEEHSEMNTTEMVRASRRRFLQQLDNKSEVDTQNVNTISNASADPPVSNESLTASRAWSINDNLATEQPSMISSAAEVIDTVDFQQSPEAKGEARVEEASIFDTYKRAYPSYDQSSKNFVRACVYLQWLLEKKSAPHPCLWDDFIRAFSSDYRQYVSQCRVNGEKATSCIDFYNTNIQEPTYTKRVLSQSKLSEALLLDVEETAKVKEKFRRKSHIRDQDDLGISPFTQSQGQSPNIDERQSHDVDSTNMIDDKPENLSGERTTMAEDHGHEFQKPQSSHLQSENRASKRPFFETPSQLASNNQKRHKSGSSFHEEKANLPTIDEPTHQPPCPSSPILGEDTLDVKTPLDHRKIAGKHSKGRLSLDPKNLSNLSELAKKFVPRRKRASVPQ